ncbi:hypothetical protein NW767_015624 [Fusarium falciforme]|nr:hypothetical protein NW767_015624 [Fusarium falciforme]
MRYEDNDWNLDRDLKQKKGHCLNSLDSQRFKLDKDTLLSPSTFAPRSVKRVHEIFDKPTFMKNVNGSDVQQGAQGNCWFTGALTALGNLPDELKRICVAYDTEVGIYGFVFFRDGEWTPAIIDDKLYLKSADWNPPNIQRHLLEQISHEGNEDVYRKTYQTGSKALFFAQCRDQNETWVPLIEKAYAKAHGDYASLFGGWMSEGLEDLSGNVATGLQMSNISKMDEFWDEKMSRANDEFLFGASTDYLGRDHVRPDGISEGHGYVVMDARKLKSGQRLVKLRDPRGKVGEGTWKGPWSDGSKELAIQALEELGHTPGSDSVFWMSYEDFMKTFTHLDCMLRFRGLDWRCCQRWIAVDVPWMEEYYKKFQFKLTKKSPLCLVLSQLDRKYYVGLWGQYSFRLDFRLHKEDSPDAEDYVARPHGNYVVHLKVTCERDVNACSVEEVVKHECRNRVKNKKFAQVGHSYDLAHGKARSYMDERIKLRQEKASECRQKKRRLSWDLRQTRGRAFKQQRRREAWEAKQDRQDEEYNAKVKAERVDMKMRLTEAEAKVSEAVEEADGESKGEAFNGAETKSGADKDVLDSIEGPNDSENPKAETAGAVSISPGSPNLTPKSVESVDEVARNNQAAVQDDDETEEEGAPDPWNAVCVVGIRVYSKDSGLELHAMMEGDEFLERHEACHRT